MREYVWYYIPWDAFVISNRRLWPKSAASSLELEFPDELPSPEMISRAQFISLGEL